MHKALPALAALTTVCALSPSAFAEPVIDRIGARIGGYGFREGVPASGAMSGTTGWQACRMNGLGMFASRDLDSHFFIEGGLDTYFTDNAVLPGASGEYSTPIDRVSGLLTAAAGARAYRDSLISPFAQIGIGAELTRVRLPELGMEDTAVLPMGFFGGGADLRLGKRLKFATTIRVNAMGYYDDAQFQGKLKSEPELATQAQFSLSYQL